MSRFLGSCHSCYIKMSEVVIENGILKFNIRFSSMDHILHWTDAVIIAGKQFDDTVLAALNIRRANASLVSGRTWNFAMTLDETMINLIKMY